MNPLVVLGATGSIGRQALEVATHLQVPVVGLAARRLSPELLGLAARYPEATVGVTSPRSGDGPMISEALGSRALIGPDALDTLAALPGCTVLNGVVGAVGLSASAVALEAGNRLALANKESLVAGGPVLLAAKRRGGGELIPVDSEHSAVLQCMAGEEPSSATKIVLTASGGPFLGWSLERLEKVSPEEALRHPTWRMGPRITIDSATLMNKGFEVIEAHYLFDMPYDSIEVVIHPQSLVHAMVEFSDGSVKAQLGDPDMRVPIQYALTYPTRSAGKAAAFGVSGRQLTFERPDPIGFPALALAYEAGRRGGSAPAVLNAADEVAVEAFLAGRIGFLGIVEVVERTLERVHSGSMETVDDVRAIDGEAREAAGSFLARVC